jgi:hypothetical protein
VRVRTLGPHKDATGDDITHWLPVEKLRGDEERSPITTATDIAAVPTARLAGWAVVLAGLIASVVLSTQGNEHEFTCHLR